MSEPEAIDRPRDPSGSGGDRRVSLRQRIRDKRRNMPWWQELPLLLVIAFCMAVLLRTFLVQAFYIPSGSMEQTLLVGDRVLVNKVVYDFWQPERGEVVVFRGTDRWAPEIAPQPSAGVFGRIGRGFGDLVGISEPNEKDFIKRIIGLPGDVVTCCSDGKVTVNGQPLDEPYVFDDSPLADPTPGRECRVRKFARTVVEPGKVFVMGDHRGVSQDSRCNGQVPIKNIIGKAFVIAWPAGRWDSLSVPKTFDSVPKARPVALEPALPVTPRREYARDYDGVAARAAASGT